MRSTASCCGPAARPRSSWRHDGGVPFTCEACGRRSPFPDLIPAVGDVLRCPHCADERPFVRPPLLVVTGTAGIGKSTLCARLAGTIPGALLLDADILAEDLISVVSPKQDYPAFWRSMMRLAHEVAQNNVVVVCLARSRCESASAAPPSPYGAAVALPARRRCHPRPRARSAHCTTIVASVPGTASIRGWRPFAARRPDTGSAATVALELLAVWV